MRKITPRRPNRGDRRGTKRFYPREVAISGAATSVGPLRRFDLFRNRPLLTLMLGHFTVDMYAGLLPVLYPVLIQRFSLDLKTVGLVSLAYAGASSIVQPLFGWIADRTGTRLVGVAMLWTAATFATIGFAPSFPILLALAAAAGVGSGMYHPVGALGAAAALRDPRQRNTAMSVYVTGGTVGVAVGPLLGILLYSTFGIHGTALTVIPGFLVALWLFAEMRAVSRASEPTKAARIITKSAIPIGPMLAIIGVMMLRQWTTASLQAFIPTWYASLGYSPSFYGALATTLVLASAVGAIGAGTTADRYGRRKVIIVSLIATIPSLLAFAQIQGSIAFVSVALVGLSAASTGPLMLVMAQQLMVGRAGVATGLILGLGFVTGAVGIPVTGAIADAFGFPAATRFQVLVVLATIVVAAFLPSEERVRRGRDTLVASV